MAETAEERMARWWAEWWTADYSWAGLAKETPHGSGTPDKLWVGWRVGSDDRLTDAEATAQRPANLQDYWRRGPGSGRQDDARPDAELDIDLLAAGELLKAPNGDLWHLAHVPATWPGGVAAKAAWPRDLTARLSTLLTARLDAADGDADDNADGPDLLAQFRGAVFQAAPAPSDPSTTPIAADFGCSCFLAPADFSRPKNYPVPTFSGPADFRDAIFSSDAWFQNATFSHIAGFENAAFLSYSGFQNAAFLGGAWFQNAGFFSNAWFQNTTFSSNASFENATFSRNAWFQDAIFVSGAGFENTVFSNEARFGNATFSDRAWFQSATFSSVAGFHSATFSSDALFEDATFASDARFQNATFAGTLDLQSAVFLAAARFTGQPIDLIKGGATQPLRLEAADPAGVRVGALTTDVGPTERARRSVWSVIANGTLFAGDVDFGNRDVLTDSTFEKARFLGLASFHGAALSQGVSFRDAEFEAALDPRLSLSLPDRDLRRLYAFEEGVAVPEEQTDAAYGTWLAEWTAKRTGEWAEQRLAAFGLAEAFGEVSLSGVLAAWFRRLRQRPNPPRIVDDDAWNSRHGKLEHAFRTLKQAMEQARHRADEALFFRLELQAKEQRRNIAAWERIASRVYGVISGYGNSVWRPLASLLVVIWLSAGLAWGAAPELCHIIPVSANPPRIELRCDGGDQVFEALSFSWNNIFQPLRGPPPPRAKGAPETVTDLLVNRPGAARVLAVRILSTFESLVGLLLIFLAGLALRRRFQIN